MDINIPIPVLIDWAKATFLFLVSGYLVGAGFFALRAITDPVLVTWAMVSVVGDGREER